MRTQKITFLLAGLLFCWVGVMAKYELIVTNPSSVGSCDGSITAKTDGSAAPYTFDWFDSSGNPLPLSVNLSSSPSSPQSTISSLCNLDYKVIITNAYGCETTLYPNLVHLEITVFLEGAYDGNNEMTTVLNTDRGLLPGQKPASGLAIPTPAGQPYQIAPWDYEGIEGYDWTSAYYSNEIVDWVLVSVRSGTAKSTELETKAGLLKKNGEVIFVEPFNNLLDVAQVYVVVEHRNHLPVMSTMPVDIVSNVLSFDFTSSNSYGEDETGAGQVQKDGLYMMIAGNFEQEPNSNGVSQSHDINGSDKTIWFDNNGVFDSYNYGDANLDGDINGSDKALWFGHNGKFSVIPK